ncbi:hypothetical protein JXQ70_18520 [bacterium]|nr:hypothetical protein [bacterium]
MVLSKNKLFCSLVIVVLLGAVPVFSQMVKDGQSALDALTLLSSELRVVETNQDVRELKESFVTQTGIDLFLSDNDDNWHVIVDKRRGVPSLIDGGAIPFIPGVKNTLSWLDFGASCESIRCLAKEEVESRAREFLEIYPGLFPVSQAELVMDPEGTLPIGESIYLLRFQWVIDNIPVERGSLFFRINNGNLIQVASTNIASIGKLDTKPSLPLEIAWDILQEYLGKEGVTKRDEIVEPGRLVIVPITVRGYDANVYQGPIGTMHDFALCYRITFRRSGVIGTWEALINAHTGELLRFVDANRYGQIQGGVYKTDKNPTQTEVTMTFPYADYGTSSFADMGGLFSGTTGTSTMTGRTGSSGNVGSVDISDNCGAISLVSDAEGLIDFGTSTGTDCTTPGVGGAGNTHASRTQYYNVAWIKIKAYTYLTGNTWLQGVLTDNVNINSTCNAYWSGSTINFYRSGGGCGNTGEIPGVSLHEWGHGMDDNDGSGGQSPPVETRADWTAILQTHQSCAGGGFFMSYDMGCGNPPSQGSEYHNCGGYGDCCLDCSGIRDSDWAQHASNTPWTPANNVDGGGSVWGSCGTGSYQGPCGWEDHCEAGFSSQALWDLVNRDLPTYCSMDITSAWQLVDRLWYSSMPQLGDMYTCTPPTSNGCGSTSLFNLFRSFDDDGDGTSNGTPHAQGIFQAFERHMIACGAAGDESNQNQTSCPPLVVSTLSGVAGSNSAVLTWGAVTNATRYFVYRNDTSCDSGFTKIATVTIPMTSYTDTTVINGVTSYYRIQAATNNDSCVSAMSNCVEVTPQPCAGTVTLDNPQYNCAGTVNVTVLDSTAPASPFDVEAWSTTDSTHIYIEVTGIPSTYTGSFTLTTGTPGSNQVQVSDGDTLYVQYTDPDYCGGGSQSVLATSTIDCQPPIISNVQISDITDSTALITWTTNEVANSRVTYDTSTPPAMIEDDLTSYVTSHAITLTGLTMCTDYYFSVTSVDPAANSVTDDNSGAYYSFETWGRVYSFQDDMESGINGWTSSGLWHQVTEPTCTPSAQSPSTSWYYGQDSDCTFNTGSTTSGRLYSTPFEVDPGTFLEFWYRRNTECGGCCSYDDSIVQISTDGGSNWDTLEEVCDDTDNWVEYAGYDLSAYAGQTVNLGFYFNSVDSVSNSYTGWMIDDVSISKPAACGAYLAYESNTFTDDCSVGGTGDGDGLIDAGESVTVIITAANEGSLTATGVSAVLSSSTPGVTVSDNWAAFPDIPAYSTGVSLANHFTYQVSQSVACGTTLDFTIEFSANGDSWTDYFSMDVGEVIPGNFSLIDEDFESSWGTYGDNPPAGWTIEDYGDEGTPTWNANDWYRYSKGGANSYIARVYYSPLENQDEWLITPTFAIPSGATSVNLEYDHYFRVYSSGEYGYVDFRSTQNPTWTNLVTYSSTTTDMAHVTISLLAYAGNTNCELRFRYVGYNGWNWDLDNVLVSGVQEGTCNMTLCEGGCTMTVDVTPNGTTTVCSGTNIVFTATPTGGTSPYSYQWTQDGSDISGATNATLTRNYGTAQSHSYNCKVSDAGSCVDIVDATNSIGTWELTPGAPVITSVTDLNACAATGVSIVFTAGSGASSHNLWVDGSQAATGITSPYTYVPGDTSSHSYVVRAINGSCYANSNAMAGTDFNDGVTTAPVITSIVDQDPLVQDGIFIYYMDGSPAMSHDLWRDGIQVVTGYVTGALYDPGDTNSHNYVIRAINGACSADSNTMAATDEETPSVPPEITPIGWTDKTTLSWSEEVTATDGYVLYRGELANLANLLNSDPDFCIRWTGTSSSDTSAGGLTETTTLGDCYYYLVVGVNSHGNGTAGSATAGERQVNDTGLCYISYTD